MWNYARFFVSAAVWTTSSLLWHVTHRRLAVSYRRFRAAYRSHLQGQAVQEESWSVDRYLPTFRDNLSITPSSVKQSKKNVFFLDYLKIGPKRGYIIGKVRCLISHKNENVICEVILYLLWSVSAKTVKLLDFKGYVVDMITCRSTDKSEYNCPSNIYSVKLANKILDS